MTSLEPATTAKVILVSTKGPIEIDIWAKEVPNVSRQFIQNCIDKKYVGMTFSKVIKDYLIQTSKINEQGPLMKDEFHSRLKYNKRGLLGAVHNDKRNTTNVDSIFITLKPTPEFNNNYVLFGKLVGESIYNVVKINESELESEETPLYPAEITDIKIPIQYFEDLVKSEETVHEPPKKKAKKVKKNQVKLDYDVEDDQDTDFKMKSAHDLLQDKRLSNKLYANKKASNPNKAKESAKNDPINEAKDSFEEDIKTDARNTQHNDDLESRDTIPMDTKRDEKSNIKVKRRRDPNIDSDYDSDLDLSESESMDLTMFAISTTSN